MAWASKELKDRVAPKLRELAKSYGVSATVARNHGTLVLNVQKGKLDFATDYNNTSHLSTIQVNPYAVKEQFNDKSQEFLLKALEIMNDGNWDRSDMMTDYWDIGWYCDINIGKWDRPYTLTV